MSLYRVLDPAFYRARAESRARAQRHLRRKALLRWLLSREVRIAIAVILAGLVIMFSAFADEVRERRRGVERTRGEAIEPPGSYTRQIDSSRALSRRGLLPQTRAGIKPGRRLSRTSEAPRERALGSPSVRGLDFHALAVGRSEPLVPDGVTYPEARTQSSGPIILAQTLDGTPPPGERTPVQSAKLFLAAQALLFLSLALGCFLVLYGFRLAREAERESEGKVTDGWLRRNRPGGWE